VIQGFGIQSTSFDEQELSIVRTHIAGMLEIDETCDAFAAALANLSNAGHADAQATVRAHRSIAFLSKANHASNRAPLIGAGAKPSVIGEAIDVLLRQWRSGGISRSIRKIDPRPALRGRRDGEMFRGRSRSSQ
jgi:hypothetical protein